MSPQLRKINTEERTSISLYVPCKLWESLQDAAYARDISRNRLVTEILQCWLAESEVTSNE